jgi:hypothetical protein
MTSVSPGLYTKERTPSIPMVECTADCVFVTSNPPVQSAEFYSFQRRIKNSWVSSYGTKERQTNLWLCGAELARLCGVT